MKKYWIEVIRVFATLAIILLHISTTTIDDYISLEIGNISNYIILDVFQLVCRWAVPCFIMITGALLLNPSKTITKEKIAKYILRIVIVLLTFGTFYSFLEIFFEKRTINLEIIVTSFLNVLQGKSWTHLWYLYTLIGLYIITPILRIVVKNLNEKDLFNVLTIFFIGSVGINTINHLLNLNLENYMLVNIWVLYYLIGYYMTLENNKLSFKKINNYFIIIIPITFMLLIDVLNIIKYQQSLKWIVNGDNIFIFFYSIGIFNYIKQKFNKENENKTNKIIEILSKYSFSIYILHPFWINLIYKVMKVTPLNFPIFIGILIMFLLIFILTLISAFILKKIPFIKKYV